jgi:Flp pilus assembly protein TadB
MTADGELRCRRCRERPPQPPGRRRPVRELLSTILLLLLSAYAVWRHADAASAVTVLVLAGAAAVQWLLWWQGCRRCARLRRRVARGQ